MEWGGITLYLMATPIYRTRFHINRKGELRATLQPLGELNKDSYKLV